MRITVVACFVVRAENERALANGNLEDEPGDLGIRDPWQNAKFRVRNFGAFHAARAPGRR
jgi:hypothetical protein